MVATIPLQVANTYATKWQSSFIFTKWSTRRTFSRMRSLAILNRRTGELRSVHDDEVIISEDDVDLEDLPEWQRDDIPLIREILESEDWIPLPSSYDINE